MFNRDYIELFIRKLTRIQESERYQEYLKRVFTDEDEKICCGLKEALSKNKQFRNIHNGKRAFILGNGPSLGELDFAKLENEIVFTVNQLPIHKDYVKLKANYHVITDLNAFGIHYRDELIEDGFLEMMEKVFEELNRETEVKLIVPYNVKKTVEEKFEKNKTIYIYQHYGMPPKKYHSYDMTGSLPVCNAVIQTAIICALYMGIKIIYLVGCDQSSIVDALSVYSGGNIVCGHFCSEEDEFVKNAINVNTEKRGLDEEIRREYFQRQGFLDLYNLCRRNRVRLVNLSKTSTLSYLPRGKLNEIIDKG